MPAPLALTSVLAPVIVCHSNCVQQLRLKQQKTENFANKLAQPRLGTGDTMYHMTLSHMLKASWLLSAETLSKGVNTLGGTEPDHLDGAHCKTQHRNKRHMKLTHLQLRAGANHVVVAFRAHDSGQIATGKLQAHSLQFLCMVLLCQS